ncbi:5-(carboxyamino)imidazole ribonucleotide synthase [Robbsia andropogonis]|uniref:5-(carboxyamino)imidazole ribonucleotide synthase n=1 Tax=Robbsia andropogonis TaxID=28092 RepID=UPI000464C250|nr:5-(carboxyamino)imidazole ribonucleotide synthase [Robbsia andropogonis]MCP1116571.1 5-(carboxyamino)imidazole ribonucleotide synthase [Robbsia andropogonis]MCP1126750.1 5-(carboxyamino)imidazole ribonucleotide synthase [Robbsia andropogonis]
MQDGTQDRKPYPKVLPGAWLGVLGGGQLGRMFCHAAQAMGYKVAVLEPDATSPAGMVADRHIQAAYDDPTALATLAQLCEAVTTEFENVPAAALDKLAETVRVSPPGRAVAIAQDRIAEKQFLAQCVGVAPHLVIESQAALDALDDGAFTGVLPGILKTARMGYDGKGQVRVESVREAREAFAGLGGTACILEKRLSLDYEVSALVARGADGETVVYPIAQNTHIDGILAETVVPAPSLDLMHGLHQARLAAQVADQARTIVTALGYVGVLCIEFFVLTDGTLVANEMAPRPHNSGHYTIDACVTSQFEQQVRAMTGLPLGDTRQHSPAVMLNVLGDIWFQGADADVARTPPWDMIVALPEVHIHLYGKEQARKGRKMGHVTVTGPDAATAKQRARQVAQDLGLPAIS